MLHGVRVRVRVRRLQTPLICCMDSNQSCLDVCGCVVSHPSWVPVYTCRYVRDVPARHPESHGRKADTPVLFGCLRLEKKKNFDYSICNMHSTKYQNMLK